MKRKILSLCISIVIFTMVLCLNMTKVYAYESDTAISNNYLQNVANSIEDYQLIYNSVRTNTIAKSSKQYNIYVDNFAGAFIDDNGILNIALVDNTYIDTSEEELKTKITDLNTNNDVIYKYYEFSYNYLQEILNTVEEIMIQYDIDSAGIDDELNKVFIETSSSNEEQILNYLIDEHMYSSNAILFYSEEDLNVDLNANIAYSGETIYNWIDSSTISRGTIGVNAVCNDTGRIGVLTNEHVAPLNTSMRYGGHITIGTSSVSLQYYSYLIGNSVKAHNGDSVDAAFVQFQNQEDWEVSPYSKYDSTIYNNIMLGNDNQIVRGQPILRIGQTTGITTGEIRSTNVSVNVDNSVKSNLFRYTNEGEGGDSGGPVYYNDGTNLYLLGLHFASGDVFLGGRQGIACRISNVMTQLNVTPITNDSFDTTVLSDNTIQLDKINFNPSGVFVVPSSLNGRVVSKIGPQAFKDRNLITKFILPNSVTEIGTNAFENCTSLQSIELSNSLQIIGQSAFKGCTSLVGVDIPNTVTNIDSSAFENCSSLTSITLSNNLVAIGTSAFKGCSSLKSISIPNAVTNIDSSAFENCSSLNNVIVLREIDDITHLGEKVFNGCSSSLQISVPQNRVAEYKNKIYWSSYKSKIIPNSNSFDEYELDCYRVFDIELTLNSKYNKLYKLNVNCAKNYKIVSTANSTVEMKIYDSNMNLVTSGNNLISHYLGKGVYYLDLRFVDDEDSGVITTTFQLTWPVSKYDISMGNTNLLTHLHETTNGNFINKLYLQSVNGEGFYKFTITGYDKNNNLIILPSNAIKVYRSGTTDEIINCYSMIDSSVFAENSENMNSLIVYLYDYLGFYIDICLPTNEYNSLTLNIQKVTENIVDLFELSESQDQNVLNFSGISLGDNLQKMVLKQAGRFELDTNGFSQGQFVVLKVRAIVDDTMVFAEPILYDLSLNNQYEFDMLEGTYYVGYIGADLNVNLSCVLTRKVTIYGDSYLDPDPNFVGVNGSEVTLNGGLQYSNEITQGFTRVIYLTTGESRLDYYWYSSDENVARITDFGTVVGLNVNNDTSVKIMAVNIEDPSKVFVKEFIIKKDTKTFDSDPIERYGEIIIDTDVSNEAQIDLSELNVPINWLQYFTWSSSDSDLYVDQFGRIFADEETIGNTYTITGTYKLNSRVKVYITVKVE